MHDTELEILHEFDIMYLSITYAPLAQLVEQGTFNPKVAGSIPSRPTTSALLAVTFDVTTAASAHMLRLGYRPTAGLWFLVPAI